MEESFPFPYSLLEYLFTWVGLLLFLLDIALDIRTVVLFYQDGDYVYMAVMIFLLLGSSILLQVFSWLWYSDCLDELKTKAEAFADRHKLIKPLHFLQLGLYLRSVIYLLLNFPRIVLTNRFRNGVVVLLNQDLQMLRLFEAFSESAPQLILLMCRILQRGELELITGLKILSSAASIASTEALYHRSMCSYLHKNREMSWIPTGIYFLWNLLLIIPRVTALALFCSVLPRYIIAHFLSLWMLLVLGVWSQKTDHMESLGLEWLFRATVGIIWYFSWFKVSTNCVMGLDTVMLLGFWCWKEFEYTGCWSSLNPYIVIPTLVGLHVVGILVKIIYYTRFHPNCDEQKIAKPSEHQKKRHDEGFYSMNTGSVESLSEDRAPAQPVTGVLKRGRNMAAHFYH
ncbi:hypothetical protein PO909_004694 [Leuciscus waleckii]